MAVFLVGLVHPRSYRRAGAYVQVMAIGGFLAWAFSVQGGRYLVALVPLITPGGDVLARRGRRLLVAVAVLTIAIAIAQRTRHPVTEVPVLGHLLALARGAARAQCQLESVPVPESGASAPTPRCWASGTTGSSSSSAPSRPTRSTRRPPGSPGCASSTIPEAFARALADRGFTHVVVNPKPLEVYLSNNLPFSLLDDRVYPLQRLVRDKRLWHAFVTRYLEPMPWPGRMLVYRLRPL